MQGNVKEAQYDVDFFKSFDLIMNGLDNLEARRHVNRLCLAAETPLIESGTAGYLGQVCRYPILLRCYTCMTASICKQPGHCGLSAACRQPLLYCMFLHMLHAHIAR